MTDEAWLIPVHPPKFPHIAKLLESARAYGVPGTWIPLFTNAADARSFYDSHPQEGLHFIVEDVVDPGLLQAASETRSIVNVKKLAAVWELHRSFERLHVIDAECVVLVAGDATRSAALRRERSSWAAHPHTHPAIRAIQQATLDVFDVRDRGRLSTDVLTDRWLYSWFEDVPTYWRDDTSAFFRYFGCSSSAEPLLKALSWATFDHLLYQYYCCLDRGWRLTDTGMRSPTEPHAQWELWRAGSDAGRSAARSYAHQWASSWVVDRNLAPHCPGVFMAYHQDEA